jgi:hypothetical protein
MALRYKARCYDEVEEELPTWREKAARYDEQKSAKWGGIFGMPRREWRMLRVNGAGTKHDDPPCRIKG